MTTKADFRRMVLSHLTVIDATEDPDAEQTALLDPIIAGARGLLLQKGLCWWDDDTIPAEVSLPFRDFVCALAAASFGRTGKGYEAAGLPARRQISALKSSEQREVVRGEFS
jgi:hypothetical protein